MSVVSDIWMLPSIAGTLHFVRRDRLRGYLLQSLIQARPTRWTYTMIPSPVPHSSTSDQVNLYHDTFSSPSFKHFLPGEPIPWYLLHSRIQQRLPGETILETFSSPSFNHTYQVNLYLLQALIQPRPTKWTYPWYILQSFIQSRLPGGTYTYPRPLFHNVLPGEPIP